MVQTTIWDNMNGTQKLLGVVLVITLITGLAFGGYGDSFNKNDKTCFGCLALQPEIGGGWNTASVDHPEAILNDLDSYDVVMLFFWQPGCGPCTEQWEEMVAAGLVSGTEANGQMVKYSNRVKLYSVDATQNPYTDWFRAYASYAPDSMWGTPMTSLIVEYNNDFIWYSNIDKMSVEDVEEIIHEAFEYSEF